MLVIASTAARPALISSRRTISALSPDWEAVITSVPARSSAPADAQTVDLEGGFLMPSFGDGHAHPLYGGLEAAGPAVRPCRSVDEILAADAWARIELSRQAEPTADTPAQRERARDRLAVAYRVLQEAAAGPAHDRLGAAKGEYTQALAALRQGRWAESIALSEQAIAAVR